MSIVVNVNGESINYPQTGDTNWGDEATDFAVQTSSALAKVGLSTGTTVNIAGTLGISNGTASAPSLSPSGNTNTGLYSIGTNKLGFSANGTRVGEFGVGYGGFTGNIIQVVSSTQNFQTNITGTAFQNLNSASGVIWETAITPKFENSKIFVLFTLQLSPPVNDYIGFRLSSKINAGSYSVVYNPQIVSGAGAIDLGFSTSGGYVILTRPVLYTPTYSPGNTITHKIEGSCNSPAVVGSVNTLRTGTGANNGHSEIFLFEIAG